eukprot:c24422_g1_i1 orf=87-1529(-)
MSGVADCFDLLGLPSDALICVLYHLYHQDVLRLGSTCRALRQISLLDCVWMEFCSPWENCVNTSAWRSRVDSGLALFRLLFSFNKIVGVWKAKELFPRGGLLYVTWGDSSLVACRVLAGEAGGIKLRHLFELVGVRDGSFKLELITVYRSDSSNTIEIRLPGYLVWSSIDSGFHIEVDGSCKPYRSTRGEHFFQQDENQDDSVGLPDIGWGLGGQPGLLRPDIEETQQQVNAHRRFDIIQRFLLRRFSLGDDHLQNVINLPVGDHGGVEHRELSRGYRALHYLLQLISSSAPTDTNVGETTDHEAETSTVTGRIAQSFYCRLEVGEPEVDKELSGLWSGLYGPHGLEIINVSYTNEEIVGTKVLGDPNVPCGKISFKARLSTESNNIPVELQSIVEFSPFTNSEVEFHVVKLYDGFGCIAGYNFQNPQWVLGKLLVNQGGQIAFLWEDGNFFIPFKRVDLASLYHNQKDNMKFPVINMYP